MAHAELVNRIAHHMAARLPKFVDLEDLIQAGMLGLLQAAKGYEPRHGASFTTYAGIRIRGAMVDEIRRYDWTPRSVHKKSREIRDARAKIEARQLEPATDEQIAIELELSLEQLHRFQQDTLNAGLFSLYDEDIEDRIAHIDTEQNLGPDEKHSEDERRKLLIEAINNLPEKEQLVMSLYYVEELNMREVGEILKVTESRVSQLHASALNRIRDFIQ